MYVSGPIYPGGSYLRREMDGDYSAVPPRIYPHDCYPSNPAAPADGKPRPSFYISDILYPSVIPLPGTLPTAGPGHCLTPPRPDEVPAASSGSSPPVSERSGPDSPRKSPDNRGCVRIVQPLPIRVPPVKSKDLKFGIDNILNDSDQKESNETETKELATNPTVRRELETAKRGFVPVHPPVSRTRAEPHPAGPLHGPHLAGPDVPPCTILYSPSHPYHHHPLGTLSSPPHPASARLAPTSTGLPSNLPGRYGHHRPSEYPGVSSPGLCPTEPVPLPAHGSGRHQSPLASHSAKRTRPLSVALCWPTVRFHHGPYSVLGSGTDASAPQSQPKRKRSWSRAVFTNLQRKGLEKRFEVQKYVTKPDRRQVAAMLGLTDAQVKVWFQNRRMKWRHQEEAKRKKEEEEKKKKESEERKSKETPVDQPEASAGTRSGSVEREAARSPHLSGVRPMEEGEYSSDEERELRIDTLDYDSGEEEAEEVSTVSV